MHREPGSDSPRGGSNSSRSDLSNAVLRSRSLSPPTRDGEPRGAEFGDVRKLAQLQKSLDAKVGKFVFFCHTQTRVLKINFWLIQNRRPKLLGLSYFNFFFSILFFQAKKKLMEALVKTSDNTLLPIIVDQNFFTNQLVASQILLYLIGRTFSMAMMIVNMSVI